jgi:hypothetical protein
VNGRAGFSLRLIGRILHRRGRGFGRRLRRFRIGSKKNRHGEELQGDRNDWGRSPCIVWRCIMQHGAVNGRFHGRAQRRCASLVRRGFPSPILWSGQPWLHSLCGTSLDSWQRVYASVRYLGLMLPWWFSSWPIVSGFPFLLYEMTTFAMRTWRLSDVTWNSRGLPQQYQLSAFRRSFGDPTGDRLSCRLPGERWQFRGR